MKTENFYNIEIKHSDLETCDSISDFFYVLGTYFGKYKKVFESKCRRFRVYKSNFGSYTSHKRELVRYNARYYLLDMHTLKYKYVSCGWSSWYKHDHLIEKAKMKAKRDIWQTLKSWEKGLF